MSAIRLVPKAQPAGRRRARLRIGLPRPQRPGRAFRRRASWLAVAAAIAGVFAVTGRGGDSNHYALDQLRDCLALHGSLVVVDAGARGSEGAATLDLRGDKARLAFAATGKEAREIARAVQGAKRHGNLVVYSALDAQGSVPGPHARTVVTGCLSVGEGRPQLAATGYVYPAAVLDQFLAACKDAETTQAQCRCVLTQAQAVAPPDVFERLAVTTVPAEEELMTRLLDSCALVG